MQSPLMDDFVKPLMLFLIILLTLSIIAMVLYEYQTKEERLRIFNYWDEAGIDFKSGQYGDAFVERCLEMEVEPLSKEYYECCYDFLADNYSAKDLQYIMLRFFEEGYSSALEDAEKACVDKI